MKKNPNGLSRILSAVYFIILVAALLTCATGHADDLNLMRRWVIFPFASDNSIKAAAENAWWKSRERVTNSKRYLVASKQLLIQKDAFQPRKDLNPDDVRLLANLLEADVIVTGYSENRQFTLNVYLAQNGALFWSKHLSYHPSLKSADQLELTSDKLTQDLLKEVPYQAFTVIDPLIGKPVYEENGKKYVVIDAGATGDLDAGSEIQWVDVILPKDEETPQSKELKFQVVGEGHVVKAKNGVITAELTSVTNVDAIKEKTLVRIPSENSKNQDSISSGENHRDHLALEMIPTAIKPVAIENTGSHKNTLVFGSIISFLGIIALAL